MDAYSPHHHQPTPEQSRLLIRIVNELNQKRIKRDASDEAIEFVFYDSNIVFFHYGILFGADDGINVHIAFMVGISPTQMLKSLQWFEHFPNCVLSDMPSYFEFNEELRDKYDEDDNGIYCYFGDDARHAFSRNYLAAYQWLSVGAAASELEIPVQIVERLIQEGILSPVFTNNKPYLNRQDLEDRGVELQGKILELLLSDGVRSGEFGEDSYENELLAKIKSIQVAGRSSE